MTREQSSNYKVEEMRMWAKMWRMNPKAAKVEMWKQLNSGRYANLGEEVLKRKMEKIIEKAQDQALNDLYDDKI